MSFIDYHVEYSDKHQCPPLSSNLNTIITIKSSDNGAVLM